MSAGGSQATIERLSPSRLRLGGRLDFATAAGLYERGLEALGAEPTGPVEVDCSAVVAADSAGLAVLIGWLGWAKLSGRVLRYAGLPEPLLALARISEVESLLKDGAAG